MIAILRVVSTAIDSILNVPIGRQYRRTIYVTRSETETLSVEYQLSRLVCQRLALRSLQAALSAKSAHTLDIRQRIIDRPAFAVTSVPRKVIQSLGA